MTELRYHFEPGERRFIWLDEDGDRTSPYHKNIPAAYRYREALMRVLNGEKVWSPAGRKPMEPQGSGKPPVKLVKVVMAMEQTAFTDDEMLDMAAAERLGAAR